MLEKGISKHSKACGIFFIFYNGFFFWVLFFKIFLMCGDLNLKFESIHVTLLILYFNSLFLSSFEFKNKNAKKSVKRGLRLHDYSF